MNFKELFSNVSSRMAYLKLMFIAILFLTVTSCSKEKDDVDVLSGDKVTLKINIEGVQGPEVSSSLRASIDNQVGLKLPEKRNVVSTYEDDVFFEVISEEEYLPSNLSSITSIKKKLSATDPMETGIKYRLILFNSDTDQFYITAQAKVGEESHIPVTPGQTYNWIAYSYNSTADIPAPSNLNNPSIVTPTNTTLLYASGTISTINDGTALPITFKHQLTQLKVEIKEAKGIRAILSTLGEFASPDYVKTCSFNLKNGSKGSLSSAGITTLNFASLTKEDTVMQVAQYYTADNDITSYNVNLSSIDVQYTVSSTRNLTPAQMTNSGNISFSFPVNPASKKGYILRGELKLTFVLPTMKILPFSNSDDLNTYRLASTTAPGIFLRNTANFGVNSDYFKIKSLEIAEPTIANLATSDAAGWARFKELMNNPANYPDLLIVGNWYNYLNYEGYELLNEYLNRGGSVLYTHDDATLETVDSYLGPGLSLILGETVSAEREGGADFEYAGVYRFTDTPGAIDDNVLRGPFGDVRDYTWGQDRYGTTYITGHSGNNLIVYSKQSLNFKPRVNDGMCFFRHKTKNFFFAGDGGFYNNPYYVAISNYLAHPFRIDFSDNDIPIIADYGNYAHTDSPFAGVSGYNVDGKFRIANSTMFGNMVAWMLNKVHYNGINRTGGLIKP